MAKRTGSIKPQKQGKTREELERERKAAAADAAQAAKVIAEGRAEATKNALTHALEKYEKQVDAGTKAVVLRLAKALRTQQRAEADAAYAKIKDKQPQTASAEKSRAYQRADDEYSDVVKRRLPEMADTKNRQAQAEEAKAAADKARHAFDVWIKFYEENAAALSPEKRTERLTDLTKRRAALLSTEAAAALRGDLASGLDTSAKKQARRVAMDTLAGDSGERLRKATEKVEADRIAAADRATAQTEKNAEVQADTDRKRLDATITSLHLELEETRDLQARKSVRFRLLSAEIDRIMAEKASADARVDHDEAAAKAKAKSGKLTLGQVTEFNLRREQNGLVASQSIRAASDASAQAGKADVRDDAAQQAANFRQRADAAQNLTDKLNLLTQAQAQGRLAAGPQSKSEYDAMLGKQYEETNGLVIEILEQQANIALLQAATTGDVEALKTAFRAFDLARQRALGPDGLAKQQHDEIGAINEFANTPGSKLANLALRGAVSNRIAGIRTNATATGNVQLANEADKAGEKSKRHIDNAARAFGREVGSGMENAGARLTSTFLRGGMRGRGKRENALKEIGGELAGTQRMLREKPCHTNWVRG